MQTYNQLRSIIGAAQAYYDPSTDAFIFPAEDEPEIYVDVVEEEKYYSIGSFVWIWEECGKYDSSAVINY